MKGFFSKCDQIRSLMRIWSHLLKKSLIENLFFCAGLDLSVRKTNNQLVTDLYIKATDPHQYLHASSCHVYRSKKCKFYSQALRLNRTFSENSSYDKCCNALEVWLRERGYSDKLVRQTNS